MTAPPVVASILQQEVLFSLSVFMGMGQQAEGVFLCLSGRGRLIGNIFQHILHPAVQDAAELLDRVSTDALDPLEPGELTGAHPVFFDEGVLGHAAGAHCSPKWGKGHHAGIPPFSLT